MTLKLNKANLFLVMLVVFIGVGQFGCVSDTDSAPDVSDVVVDTDIIRFDNLLYGIETEDDFQKLKTAYPVFFDLYFYRVLGLPQSDSLFYQTKEMIASKTFTELQTKISSQYSSMDDIELQWEKSMKYYSYYFNPTSIPDLYTTVTEFAYGSFIFPVDANQDGVGVSLDLFLGDSINYPAMSKMDNSFSAYNSRSFNRAHLVKKAVDAILDDKLPAARSSEFIYHLIREGKKYYISEKLLPFVSDTVIWEYTPAQMKWTKDNEWNIYSFLITNELYYSRERSSYVRLINPAPHTKDMPPEAPGRVVSYIAYKIVEAYMAQHPNTTYEELVSLDAKAIFENAKYKPRRE